MPERAGGNVVTRDRRRRESRQPNPSLSPAGPDDEICPPLSGGRFL